MRRHHRFLCLTFLGCLAWQQEISLGDAEGEQSLLHTLYDTQLIALDQATPYTDFDGGLGSILVGEGWAPPEEDRGVHFAWAISEEATLLLESPPSSPVDFVGDCMPFTFKGAPRQTLALSIGGQAIAPAPLRSGWQDIRIPLPASALKPGFNTLRLTFGYARKSREVDPQNPDNRRAVACRRLGLVPRGVTNIEEFLAAAELDPRTRRLRLTMGTSIAVPLPTRATVTLHLGGVRSSCQDCVLKVDLLAGSKEELIWQGEAANGSGLSLSFSTPRTTLSRLRVGLGGARGEISDPSQSVDVQLPSTFLEIKSDQPGDPEELPTHVFLYLIDTLRADALTPYRAQDGNSPQIAAFAEDSVIYHKVWSASSWTLPSVVSILTGLYPERHQVMEGNIKFSADRVPALATLLSGAGYGTVGISQSIIASSLFGIDSGFERFFLNNQLSGAALRSQDARRYLLLSLLGEERLKRPLFAYLHTLAPHSPYTPRGADQRFAQQAPGELPAEKYLPDVFMAEDLGADAGEVAHLRALYDGEVAYADRHFGRFVEMLRFLDLYDNSLIVLVSDHGEEFGEHGGFAHGRTVYEEMLQVPLIIKYPRSEWAGTEISERVSTVDLLPTILRVAGVATEGLEIDGISLLPSDLEGRSARRRGVFAEVARSPATNPVDYRAVAFENLKCVESLNQADQFGREIPRWQVFDLDLDPGEQRPLEMTDRRVSVCIWLLAQWRDRSSQRDPGTRKAKPPFEDERLDMLRSLGYIE